MASNGHLEATVMAEHTGLAAPHTLFDADTAPDAKELGDKRDLVGGLHLDTEFACKRREIISSTFRAPSRSTWTSTDPFLRRDMTFVSKG